MIDSSNLAERGCLIEITPKSNSTYARAELPKEDLQFKRCSGYTHDQHAWTGHSIYSITDTFEQVSTVTNSRWSSLEGTSIKSTIYCHSHSKNAIREGS